MTLMGLLADRMRLASSMALLIVRAPSAIDAAERPPPLAHASAWDATLRRENGVERLRSRGARGGAGVSSAGTLSESVQIRPLQFIRVGLLLGAWYTCNLVYSASNKAALELWRFPFTFGTVQLGVGILYVLLLWTPLPRVGGSAPRLRFQPLRPQPKIGIRQLWSMLPTALLLAVGHTAATAAPAYGSVAFTNVVKTTETLFASICLAVVSKQVFAPMVYVTLIPVVVGVALATVSELDFSWFTLAACGVSMNAFALYSIAAKGLLTIDVYSALGARHMYSLLCMLSFVVLIPVSLIAEGPQILEWWADHRDDVSVNAALKVDGLLPLMLATGIFNYLSNELAFCVLDLCSPLTYAVANTLKRVIVIVGSVLIFRTRVTAVGAFGATLAIAGAFLYSLSLDITRKAPRRK